MKAACAILFVIFTFIYVYCFQRDIIAMEQYSLSDGKTHYDPLIGGIIITVVLCVVSGIIGFFVRIPIRLFALKFFPALIFLGLLTAGTPEGNVVSTSTSGIVIGVLLVVAWAFAVNAAQRYQLFLQPLRSRAFLSQPWWTNMIIMLFTITMVYTFGNTDKTLHTRLAVERHCAKHHWNKALDEGLPQHDNDPSLTMLRAMALANKGQLADRLFTYNIKGTSRCLLPQTDNSVCCLLSPDSIVWNTVGFVPYDKKEPVAKTLQRALADTTLTTIKPCARDYLLCSYLLDKDLRTFSQELPKYYNVADSLPRHYAEALVLYAAVSNTPDVVTAPTLLADFKDFQTLLRSTPDPILRHSLIRKNFFGTYWYYYYQAENN